jgi:hypothetical protein
MSSFILFFSILVIIVSVCLIIFNNRSSLSNNDHDVVIEQSGNIHEEERIDHNSFEKVFHDKIEPTVKSENLFSDDNLKTYLSNERIIKSTENEENGHRHDNMNSSDNILKKINELREIGLSNQEVAKKLGKGIREIDIILKMDSLKNSSSR